MAGGNIGIHRNPCKSLSGPIVIEGTTKPCIYQCDKNVSSCTIKTIYFYLTSFFFTSNHTGSNATNNLNLLALTFKLMQVVCVSFDIFFQPWSMKRWYQFLKFKVVFFFHFLWDWMKVVLYESILEELMCTNTLKRLNLVPYCWKNVNCMFTARQQ